MSRPPAIRAFRALAGELGVGSVVGCNLVLAQLTTLRARADTRKAA